MWSSEVITVNTVTDATEASAGHPTDWKRTVEKRTGEPGLHCVPHSVHVDRNFLRADRQCRRSASGIGNRTVRTGKVSCGRAQLTSGTGGWKEEKGKETAAFARWVCSRNRKKTIGSTESKPLIRRKRRMTRGGAHAHSAIHRWPYCPTAQTVNSKCQDFRR